MKTLYESILDDEDDILGRMDKDIKSNWKERATEFIKTNYFILDLKARHLKIERYLKFDTKKGTVSIKPNVGRQGVTLYINMYPWPEELPVSEFKWDKVWNLNISTTNLKSLNNFPNECNMLSLSDCIHLKDLTGAPNRINYLYLDSLNGLKDLTGLENTKGLEELHLRNMPGLESLNGLPSDCKQVKTYNCPNLKSNH